MFLNYSYISPLQQGNHNLCLKLPVLSRGTSPPSPAAGSFGRPPRRSPEHSPVPHIWPAHFPSFSQAPAAARDLFFPFPANIWLSGRGAEPAWSSVFTLRAGLAAWFRTRDPRSSPARQPQPQEPMPMPAPLSGSGKLPVPLGECPLRGGWRLGGTLRRGKK